MKTPIKLFYIIYVLFCLQEIGYYGKIINTVLIIFLKLGGERLMYFFELGLVDYLIIILAIILIVLVAMQNSKDDLGSALTGANSELFKHQKERGAEVYVVRATYICSIIFMSLALLALAGF